MATLDTIRTRIDEIDTLLSGGVRVSEVGDTKIEYDLAALRKERDRLSRIVSNSSASQYRRVTFKNA